MAEEVELDEAKIKVSIEGLPDIYMDGQPAGQIKMQLRKMLKKPDMLKDVERVPETDYKQAMRDRVSGKDKKEPEAELDEGTKQVLAHGGKGQYKAVRDGDITKVMYKGKVVGTADFDRGADSFFASIKGVKGQKSFDDAQAMVDYFAKNKITEEVELDEGEMNNRTMQANKPRLERKGQELEAYANKSGGIDKKDMMKVAAMLKRGDKSGALKYAKTLDTDPKEYILNLLGEEADLDEGKMSQLHQYIKDKKSAEEIAKLMKLE